MPFRWPPIGGFVFPSKSTAALRSLRKRCSYRWPLWVNNSTTRFEEHGKKEASWRWPGLGWGSGGGGIKRRPGGGLPQSVWCFPPSKEIYIAHLSLNSMHEGCQAKRCRSRTGRDKKAKNDRTAFWNDPVYISKISSMNIRYAYLSKNVGVLTCSNKFIYHRPMDRFLGSSRPAGNSDLSTPTLTVDTGEASSRLGDGGPSSPKDHPPAMAQAGPGRCRTSNFPRNAAVTGWVRLSLQGGPKVTIVMGI